MTASRRIDFRARGFAAGAAASVFAERLRPQPLMLACRIT
jgi:hypothetical protein